VSSKNEPWQRNNMSPWIPPIVIVLFALTGCSTPYLEQGFKSEADFTWAKLYELTPADVEFARAAKLSSVDLWKLKKYNILNKNAYDLIINEMRTTGYNQEFPNANIHDYLYMRAEAIRNNRTVRDELLNMRATSLRKEEEKRIAELAKKAMEEKEELRIKNEKLNSDRAETEAEYIAVQRFGPICKNIKNISLSVAEWVGAKLSSNVSSVRFIRSEYSINRSDNSRYGYRIRYSSSCTVVVYADRGPLFCSVYETSVKNGIVMYVNNCSSSK
jgi:hypothetical protein